MPKVFEGTPRQFSIDGYAAQVFDTAKSVIQKDWDMIFCIDGPEGSGKSVFAQQAAAYCDPSFVLERITFTPKEFEHAVKSAQKYQAVIYDEAFTGLNSRSTMSKINKALVNMLAEIRQKNLFIFVVMPTFFDLDRYVAIWRTRGLFHVYTSDKFERGFVAFFNRDKKKDLYILGKKFYKYDAPKANFVARFPNIYMVDEAAYRSRKLASLKGREESREDEADEAVVMGKLFERLQSAEVMLTHETKAKILGVPLSTYYYKLKQFNELEEDT